MKLPINVSFSGVVSINYKVPPERLEELAAIMRMLIKAQISLTYVTGGCVTSQGVYARHALSILQTVFRQKRRNIHTKLGLLHLKTAFQVKLAKQCLLIMSTNENMRGMMMWEQAK